MDELAETYSRSLRDGTKDLIKQTYDLSIPVLVFSAGLGTPKMLSFMFCNLIRLYDLCNKRLLKLFVRYLIQN